MVSGRWREFVVVVEVERLGGTKREGGDIVGCAGAGDAGWCGEGGNGSIGRSGLSGLFMETNEEQRGRRRRLR